MQQIPFEQLLREDTLLGPGDTSGGLGAGGGGELVQGLGQRWQERCLWARLEAEVGEGRTHSYLMDRAGGAVRRGLRGSPSQSSFLT